MNWMRGTVASLGILFSVCSAKGQEFYAPYTVRYQTVYERRPVTTYRLETDTVYEKQKVTTYRPVWDTQVQTRRYRVARPYQETSTREEKYTVLRPVQETFDRTESYDRVRWVSETEMREERRTVYRPVIKTQEREERVVVRRPITETAAYDEVSTQYSPVTTYRPQVVDAGSYVDQWNFSAARQRNRLQWLGRQSYLNPSTGLLETQRGGLYWVPQPARGSYSVQRVYVPNYVTQAVPETSYVPQQVTRRVEVPVTTYRDEVEVRRVPVSVERLETQEEYRQVPVTVEKPITERIERKVPVTRTRWVPEERVRKVPVTTYRYVYEDREEEREVKVRRLEAVEREVTVPRTVRHWVAYQSDQLVPQRYATTDPCGSAWTDAPTSSDDGWQPKETPRGSLDQPPSSHQEYPREDRRKAASENSAAAKAKDADELPPALTLGSAGKNGTGVKEGAPPAPPSAEPVLDEPLIPPRKD